MLIKTAFKAPQNVVFFSPSVVWPELLEATIKPTKRLAISPAGPFSPVICCLEAVFVICTYRDGLVPIIEGT